MKNCIVVIICLLALNMHSQIENGSIAPDFTLEDWYGNTHTLYDYLEEDKTVFLEVFAAHCPGCWTYHQTDILKNVYNLYGPEGTDEAMVLALEHDIWNGYDAFNGIGDPWTTQGNWLEGTPYPQFNVEEGDRDVFDDYEISYYPIVFKICPDKTIETISTSNAEDQLYAMVQECQFLSIEEETETWKVFIDQGAKTLVLNHSTIINSINVMNLQGQIVKTIDSVPDSTLDISDLSTGVYVFQFQTDTETRVEKLVVN